MLAGFSIGAALLTRYYSGAVAGVCVLALLLRRAPQERRNAVLFALGVLPCAALLLAYNMAMTGSPWRVTTPSMTVSYWFAPGFVLRGFDMMATNLLRFIVWTPPLLLVVYLVYLWRPSPDRRRDPLEWMFVIFVISLYFYVSRGGNQYGPRLYYEAFPFVVMFAVASLFREDRFAGKDVLGRRMFALFAVGVALTPLLLAGHAFRERRVIAERMDVFRQVADAGLQNAIVLMRGRVGTSRSMDVKDLTRNGIDYRSSVLFALDRGDADNCRLLTAYPGRWLYRYTWDSVERQGRLTAVRCPAGGPERPAPTRR
jgi:hypothetical protein